MNFGFPTWLFHGGDCGRISPIDLTGVSRLSNPSVSYMTVMTFSKIDTNLGIPFRRKATQCQHRGRKLHIPRERYSTNYRTRLYCLGTNDQTSPSLARTLPRPQ